MGANDRQVGGSHYQTEYQHWDLMADIYGQGYFKAQITRYMARWRKKDGAKDLQKVVHYIEKLVEVVNDGEGIFDDAQPCVTEFCAMNKLDPADADIIFATIGAESLEQLDNIKLAVQELIVEANKEL